MCVDVLVWVAIHIKNTTSGVAYKNRNVFVTVLEVEVQDQGLSMARFW